MIENKKIIIRRCFLLNFDKVLVPFYLGSHVIETSWIKQTILFEFAIK